MLTVHLLRSYGSRIRLAQGRVMQTISSCPGNAPPISVVTVLARITAPARRPTRRLERSSDRPRLGMRPFRQVHAGRPSPIGGATAAGLVAFVRKS